MQTKDEQIEEVLREIEKLNHIDITNVEELQKQLEYLRGYYQRPTVYDVIRDLKNYVSENKSLRAEYLAKLNNIEDFLLQRDTPYIPISSIFKELYMKSDAANNNLSLLCPTLDKLTGGVRPGSLVTIAGASGCMKTTYAVNFCYNAVKSGKNVCYLSLEEPPFQLYSKLLSRVSVDTPLQLTANNIVNSKLDKKGETHLFEQVKPYLDSQLGTFHILGSSDFSNYEEETIRSKLKEVDNLVRNSSKSKLGEEKGIDILVVDHIQLLKFGSSNRDPYDTLNRYVSFFRRMMLNFLGQRREIIVILLSQINREGMEYARKHNGAYLMSHIAEGSEIERSSTHIITVYTSPTSQITKLLSMGAIKLRNSQLPLDIVNVFADGEYYQVGDTAIPTQQDYSEDILFGESPGGVQADLDFMDEILAL